MSDPVALSICGALLALGLAGAFEWRQRRGSRDMTTPRAPRCPFSLRRPLLGRGDPADYGTTPGRAD